MASQPSEIEAPQSKTPRSFALAIEKAIDRCWQKAAPPAEWGVSREAFGEALVTSAEHRFAESSPSDTEISTYLESLQVSDLAMTLACRAGNATAWDFFFSKYRLEL